MTLFPLSISKSFSGYHLVSLFFFPPGRKTLELAFSSHPLLLNVFYVELVALAKLPLIYVSHVMQWHATPCIGREGAGSGMEEQGCSWRRRAIAVGGGRFAMLTIVIYLLSSLFLGSLKKARSITQLVLAGFVLICIHHVLSGSALSHFVHNFIPSGFPRLSRKDDFHCLAPFSFQVTSPSFPSVGA